MRPFYSTGLRFRLVNETYKRTTEIFVSESEREPIINCPLYPDVQTDITFDIQRGGSKHTSKITYWRFDNRKQETFRFDKSGANYHTHLFFNGKTLTCVGNANRENQCNNLPERQPVPVIIYEIDFNPRDGDTWGKSWDRNRYTLLGNAYKAVCNSTGN